MFLLNFQRIAVVETGNFRSFTNFVGAVADVVTEGLATVRTVEGGSTGIGLIEGVKFVIKKVEEEAFRNAAELEVEAFVDSLSFAKAPITKTADITAELDYKKTPATYS